MAGAWVAQVTKWASQALDLLISGRFPQARGLFPSFAWVFPQFCLPEPPPRQGPWGLQ